MWRDVVSGGGHCVGVRHTSLLSSRPREREERATKRRDLAKDSEQFRTRLYAWLPPEGEAGAERLMRGYCPYFRRSG